MASGTVYYWNGYSGWIKQSDVEDLATAYANDVMVLQQDVVSGTVDKDCVVTFDTDGDSIWMATNVAVQ